MVRLMTRSCCYQQPQFELHEAHHAPTLLSHLQGQIIIINIIIPRNRSSECRVHITKPSFSSLHISCTRLNHIEPCHTMIPSTIRTVALQARAVHLATSKSNPTNHPVPETKAPQRQATSSRPTWQRHRDILLSSPAKDSLPAKATSTDLDNAPPITQSKTST